MAQNILATFIENLVSGTFKNRSIWSHCSGMAQFKKVYPKASWSSLEIESQQQIIDKWQLYKTFAQILPINVLKKRILFNQVSLINCHSGSTYKAALFFITKQGALFFTAKQAVSDFTLMKERFDWLYAVTHWTSIFSSFGKITEMWKERKRFPSES